MSKRFDNRTVVVTGGGGGIGGATCRRFAQDEARGRRRVRPRSSMPPRQVAAGRPRRRRAARRPSAATSPTAPASTLRWLPAEKAALGPIDVLVNNAGWDVFKPFTKTEPAQWDRLIAVNLTGALHMHHAVLPGMAARARSGRIVNIASDAARVGSSGEAVYAACKGGLVAFSKTIAREHARHGINVNVVCPGPTDTALFAEYKEGAGNPDKLMEAFTRAIPLGRIGQPADLPGAILFFASRRRSLHHRPGAQRVRRPDHERLTQATPPWRYRHELRRHPVRGPQRRGLDHHQPPGQDERLPRHHLRRDSSRR